MFPAPQIKPLERLQIQDGLLINAERWLRSHNYHRQRQNIHYQSLNQPGIVYGLGVSLIPAPKDIPSQYNDQRWLQIQPGIAIDLVGNPIIVPQAIDFHLAADITEEKPRLIYIVVSYVEPDNLQRKQVQEFEPETFRIYENTFPPNAMEVELCRILLQPGLVSLENPKDVFFPELNTLDFRYRQIARSRPSTIVRAAHLQTTQAEEPNSFANLSYLIQSVGSLSHNFQGEEQIDQIAFPLKDPTIAINYDLLFTTGRQPISLDPQELTNLKSYLDAGGVLLVESPTDAVDRLESIVDITERLETPLEDLRKLDRNYPMRQQPFLFAALPILNQKPIQILIAGGIVLVIGDLSAAWGLDHNLSLPRETIRSAQELGINILHFAWSRRHMTQLRQQQISAKPPTKPDALKSVLNKLDL
ncbi:hypothetical protein Cylst_1937 [Cylindrospermum stagnale PCC 7417]|uniref:DUF4159 domain-containing protein n=1 Tax=Cylindrospermum stagnale PCC 7417 TaxID=56107 RepID=K9WUX8_9NOST|nr:DUF4159 domain-containing protein [Cylindrospermum stagnale]AFZ24185.1 hypothetical protein Cylst_1937 [Cylindrospermum stagnale PCC 7417]